MFYAKLLCSSGLKPYVHLITPTIPVIEFSIEFQSNQLLYDKGYSIRQQMIYCLIQFMKEEGMGYRRISRKLNDWGIKTHRGNNWFSSSVISILKRKQLFYKLLYLPKTRITSPWTLLKELHSSTISLSLNCPI